jgi:hypothetical protein
MIDLLTSEQGQENLAVNRFVPPEPIEAGTFSGALTSPFVGIKHAWDVGASALADAAMPIIDKYTPEAVSSWMEEQRQNSYRIMRDSRPDARNMGVVGQVGHAVGSTLTMGLAGGLVAGPAGAALAIGGGSMYDKYKELRDQNVDEETALKVSGVTGAVMTVGSALPAFMGKTITTQVLSGIGMNVPLGVAERGSSSVLLEDAGYKEMAAQYKMLDGTAIAIDVILGAAFPLGARALRKNVPHTEVDAAMDANRGIAERESLPAIPGTLEDSARVREAEDSFARQIIEEGKSPDEVVIPKGLYENSVENPKVAIETADTIKSFEDLAVKEGYAPLSKMESDVKAMDEAFAAVRAADESVPSVGLDDDSLIRAFHGTQMAENVIDEFGTKTNYSGGESSGITWFTSSPEEASSYATWRGQDVGNPTVYPAKLSIKKPASSDDVTRIVNALNDDFEKKFNKKYQGEWSEEISEKFDEGFISNLIEENLYNKEVISELKKNGFDGVIFDNESSGNKNYVVFDSKQIKSGIESIVNESLTVAKAEEKPRAQTSDMADAIIKDNPNMTVVDENGQVVKASEMVAKSEAEFQQSMKEADLYKVAVECALGVVK